MINNILIVEDNKILSDNISKYLEIKWIKSKQIFFWKDLFYSLVSDSYDLVLLDLWLPDIDWIELCSTLREKWYNIPVLMLTSRSLTEDKIQWLESGADDYLTKPFDYNELIARINALLRRNSSVKSKVINIWKDIIIKEDSREVTKWKKNITLSQTEFNLLLFLSKNKWNIISKEELYRKVWWEYDDLSNSRKVDVYIWYLRKKIGEDTIETVRWQWYLIK